MLTKLSTFAVRFVYMTKKPLVITHNGRFHADEIFAVATLHIFFNGNYKLVRTRDENLISEADYVVDVGQIYDSDKNRYDHHQKDASAPRENGVPYSSLGLVWKRFGEKVCGHKEIADIIERQLVWGIDMLDCGMDICQKVHEEVEPFSVGDIFSTFRLSWNEEHSQEREDERFGEVLSLAVRILYNLITKASAELEAEKIIERIYEKTEDKRLIVLDERVSYKSVSKFPEPIFIVSQRVDGHWGVRAVRDDESAFKNRKDLPESWGGLSGKELQEVTGVPDAHFCHKALFYAVARSKAGALELAKLALGD